MTPLAFPAPRPSRLDVRHALFVRELSLRGAVDADLPGLRALFAATRDEELAGVPWPPETKAAFIGQQFSLQHHHFLSHYPDADFLVITAGAELAGRFYRWRAPDGSAGDEADLVIDVSLLTHWRGRGLGAALLRAAMDDAASRARDVALHVHRHNTRALRLYDRLGFAITGDAGAHAEMRWRPPASRTPPGR